jgi:peptide/nickel transport system permease protein
MAGAIVLALIVFAVVFGPLIYTKSPTELDLSHTLAGPSAAHPLGTDENGRDELARLLDGGRVSLLVGFSAMLIAVALGTAIGAISGFFGAWTDRVSMQVVDGMMSIPLFFLWLVALSALNPTTVTIAIVIGVTSWMQTARIVRSEILRTRELEFVRAARVIGVSRLGILMRHCLPQAWASIIVTASLATAYAILSVAALSFLGVGIRPPQPDWGNMLSGAQQYLFSAPMLAIYPGVAIVLTVVSVSLIGDALRDTLDRRR